MGYSNNKFGIENLSKPSIEEAQAEIERQIEAVGDPELLRVVKSAYKKTYKPKIEEDFNDPKAREYLKKKTGLHRLFK